MEGERSSGRVVGSRPILEGIRVVNLGINVPGAVTGGRLCELGADVTKLEPPGGDPVALAAPRWYARLVEGQEVRVVDLKAGLPLDDLAAADLLVTSSRPAALERLGLGWEALHDAFPLLVHVAIVGHSTPDDSPGHDLTYTAAHGSSRRHSCRAPSLPTSAERSAPSRRRSHCSSPGSARARPRGPRSRSPTRPPSLRPLSGTG